MKFYIYLYIKIEFINYKMTKCRANFNLVYSTPKWILIKDNSVIMNTMSVTNDAENVVSFLKENAILIGESILYYIDTDGRVDILEHDGKGNFTGFKPGFPNVESFYNNI